MTRPGRAIGKKIIVTRYLDYSVEVEDLGRGIPVDYNPKEGRYNWELLFCELYAGGKYNTNAAESYEYSLGLNGLGLCCYPVRLRVYGCVRSAGTGFVYELHFEKGENLGGAARRTATKRQDTGTTIRWKPDLEVFTDIAVPADYYRDILKRQAVVNPGVQFLLRNEQEDGSFAEEEFFYENGITRLCDRDAGRGRTP